MNKKDLNSFYKSKNIKTDSIKRYSNSINYFSDELSNHNVFDKLLNERIVFLTGEIDDFTTELIKANLLYLDSISNDDITLYINSGGGEVYAGLGLLDTMDYINSDIRTINTGLAASMAAVILCSGTKGKRKALKRSRTMIHQPMTFGGLQQASDLEIEAREVNSLKSELYEIISEKTNQSYNKVYKDGDRDYWMSSKDALKYGMIDEIVLKR